MTVARHPSSARLPPAWRVPALLALRGLRRNLRRSILTAAAMMLGGGMLIFAFSLSDGGQEMWIREAARMGNGHVTIEQPEFRMERRIRRSLAPEVREAVADVLSSSEFSPLIAAASPRLEISGLASSAAGARPVRISAIEPETEARLSSLDERVIAGRFLRSGDQALAFIGEGLASSLRLKPGSRLVVEAENVQGAIAPQLLRVAGIFRSGVPEVDRTTLQVPLDVANDWLGADGRVTGFSLLLAHSSLVPSTVDALERTLEPIIAEGEAVVLDWETVNPGLASAVALDSFSGYVIQILLFAIIAFGIMNTVLMSVLNRNREFGILQAIGLTPVQAGLIVLLEGMILTLVSGILGVALGTGLVWFLIGDGLDLTGVVNNMTFSGVLLEPIIVPEFRPDRFVTSTCFLLAVGAVASIYPAMRAAGVNVIDAMKFDR